MQKVIIIHLKAIDYVHIVRYNSYTIYVHFARKEVNRMTQMKWLSEHVETVRIGSDESVCANCAWFHQHYVLDGRNKGYCVPISMGHCEYPRMKDRRANETCKYFRRMEDGK